MEDMKASGYLGKVTDGVILFPTFQDQSGNKIQGVVYYGSLGLYYGGTGVKIVLPEAVPNQTRTLKVKGQRPDFSKLPEKTKERLISGKTKIIKPFLKLKTFGQ